MNELIKSFEQLTVAELVLFFWVEKESDNGAKPLYIRGRRRTMEESIMLCGGDVKRFMQYARDYDKAGSI